MVRDSNTLRQGHESQSEQKVRGTLDFIDGSLFSIRTERHERTLRGMTGQDETYFAHPQYQALQILE